mgnify:CR=1 FL=1
MGGMKVSNMDFIKLLPAFMQDDEAAIALSKAVNKLIGEPGKTSGHKSAHGTRWTNSQRRSATKWRGSWTLTGTTPKA